MQTLPITKTATNSGVVWALASPGHSYHRSTDSCESLITMVRHKDFVRDTPRGGRWTLTIHPDDEDRVWTAFDEQTEEQ